MESSKSKISSHSYGLFIIAAIFLILIIYQKDSFKTQKISVGILVTEEMDNDAEILAAFHFLEMNKLYRPQKILINEIINNEKLLKNFDVIWFHYADSTGIPKEFNSNLCISTINNYVESGGNLLLTQEAFTYLHPLGLEKTAAQLDYANAVDEGYGRKLGFHAFLDHPLFKNLNGGAYVFNPFEDQKTRQRGYFGDDDKINGDVIGIDWSYITFRENKKLILEYKKGKGNVLAIGAYILFNLQNHNKKEFEQLINNAFLYLKGTEKQNGFYWKKNIGSVIPINPIEEKMAYPEPSIWKILPSQLQFQLKKETDEFWDLTGERMMVIGHEKSGIDEIWTHPFMAIKEYRVGIKYSDNKVVWLSEINPTITITPASFKREYDLGKLKLTELISVHHDEPETVIHYEFEGNTEAEIIISFTSNLRLMWPYSHKAIGGIKYAWSDALNAFMIEDDSGDFKAFVGINRRPREQIIGQYDSVYSKNNNYYGNETKMLQCSALASFNTDAPLDIVVAASHFADPHAAEYLKKGLLKPYAIYKNADKYYSRLLKDKLMISSPDTDLNLGYRWAVIGTDRHFANTPGVGKSLVAGIGNTERGWSGGHEINGRPGYAWYFGRDSEWSAFAINAYGDYDKVKDVLKMLIKYQDMNGKIFHELTTSGAVHYDAADATPLFVVLAGKYLRASGDQDFIKKNWNAILHAMDYCYSTDTDHDLLINNTNAGHGWVEGGFLFGGKTTLYLASSWAAALKEVSYMASTLGLKEESEKYKQETIKVTSLIQNLFWNEQSSFYNHSLNTDGSFIVEKTIMPAIPMYFKQLKKENTQTMLNEFASNNFTTNWGCRIVGEESKHFYPQGYHTGSVWPLYTGWVALAEYQYGNHSQAYSHVMNNINVYKYWAKGFIEEVLHGAEYKPIGVCAHQCWSETMAIQPLIEGMLGLEVDANFNTLKLSPAVPANWDYYKVDNIKIGKNVLHYEMKRSANELTYLFNYTGKDELKIYFSPTYLEGAIVQKMVFNDKALLLDDNAGKDYLAELIVKENSKLTIIYKGGISVLPIVQNPKPGDKAAGTRIISTELKDNVYEILLEAAADTIANFKIYSRYTITGIENAFIVSDSNNIYDLEAHYSSSPDKYVRTKVYVFVDRK